MPEKELPEDLEGGLERALHAMESLQSRLESGEEIDEKELTMISRMIATQIETVRMKLEEAVGPVDPAIIQEEMRNKLSPDEFDEWVATSDERAKFREELIREQAVRDQLGEEEA